jgi:NAD(P)-dependent dehydrogenase (short-subunit alcohol dehydrogenase family)
MNADGVSLENDRTAGERVAIITGAGRGIGQAIACEMARCGMRVVIAEKAGYGEQAAAQIRRDGGSAAYIPVDVADWGSVQAMVKQAGEEFGRIDILVNNAGIRPTKTFMEMTSSDWERVLTIDLTGVFNCCKAVAPWMIAQKWGRIVNITSLAAQQGSTGGHSHYAAAKAGLIGLSKSLARELASFQITVNCVAPGWIDTEGWEGRLEGHREEFANQVPLKRLGTTEDIAYVVAFLASERASYLTGVTLPVNGGIYIS